MNALRQILFYLYINTKYLVTRTIVSEKSILGVNVYLGKGAKVIASSLGEAVNIGPKTIIEKSSLGKNIDIANNCTIRSSKLENYVKVSTNTTISKSEIGSFTYIAKNARIYHTTIGRFCSIGPDFLCGMGNHPSDFVSTSPVFFSTAKQCGTTFVDKNLFVEESNVEIGHDVWIGARVYVRDGIRIGHGAIIGAGAVVVKDVPPYTIVGGVPARLIRYRFKHEVIERLLEIEWWNWEVSKITSLKSLFAQPSVELFLQHLEEEDGIFASE
jgi:acetyltransferase-like isoleucine patch superfamily enzyme